MRVQPGVPGRGRGGLPAEGGRHGHRAGHLLNLNNPNQMSDTSITPADFVQLQGSSPQISDADALVSKIGDELVNKVIVKKEAEPAAAPKKATDTEQESPLMDGRLPRGINPNMPPDYGGVLPRVGGRRGGPRSSARGRHPRGRDGDGPHSAAGRTRHGAQVGPRGAGPRRQRRAGRTRHGRPQELWG